jgi:serine/threonine-protein kinase
VAAIVAAIVAVFFASIARFEIAPVAPVDETDRGLEDPADIVPLPVLDAGDEAPDLGAAIDGALPGTLAAPDAGEGARSDAATDETGTDAGVVRPRARDAGARGTATLVVTSTTWANVSLDGRPLGRTPLRRVSIPSGSHLLRIDCTTLGRRVEQRIAVEPGAAITVFADVDRDPPAVRLGP